MAEYRIVAKIDPAGVTSGRAKIKQELAGLDADVQRAGRSGAAALDSMTAAEFRAAGGMKGLTDATRNKAKADRDAEQAARRVIDATDKEAAAQLRLNALLKDAKLALDSGKISQEQYNRVQTLAADGLKNIAGVSSRARAGFTQLSFQVGDVAQGLALGTRASTIFAQQSGQVIQALQVMGGQGNAFLKFIGGPWGIALSTAAVVLTPFIGKLFDSSDAIGAATDKLKEDAKQSEIDRQAHERWIHTLDALIDRQGQLADKMRDRLKIQGLANQSDLQAAQKDLGDLSHQRDQIASQLKDARDRLASVRRTAETSVRAEGGPVGSAATSAASAEVTRLEGRLKQIDTAIGKANERVTGGLILTGEEQGKAMADLSAKAQHWGDLYQDALRGIEQRNKDVLAQAPLVSAAFEIVNKSVSDAASAGVHFDSTLQRAKELGIALDHGKVAPAAYGAEMRKLAADLDAATKAAKQASDGVEKFRSRQQAIGIAGRELLGAGLKVSENEQFGGVTAHHPGMGDAAHGKFAIDVNQGAGVTEANVPDIRGRFDALARTYQKRGYRVLWNGQVYEAMGDGPTRPIPGGQDQHHDHMHIEAPTQIVGRPTQSALAQAELRDQRTGAQQAESASDFVANVVNSASAKGLPDRASQLRANIGRTLKDFQTRFNRPASPGESKQITDALTAADAREISDHFQTAYVDPLKLLQAELGKTAIERAVLSAKMKEEADLGRPLTEAENAQIEARYRDGDALEREHKIIVAVRQSMEDYTQTIRALTKALAEGGISHAQFNAQMAAALAPARQLVGQVKGTDEHGQTYQDLAAVADENARYAQQQADFEAHRQEILALGINYDRLEEQAAQDHANRLEAIEQARRDMHLSYGQSIADSVYQIASAAFGKQSALARAAFAVEKGFTIARASLALYTAVANALKVPFPANIPLIAEAFAQGAVIISAIRSIVVPNAGYSAGGYTGDGGRNTPAGTVHGQEYVINADQTARHRPLLEAINAGRIRHEAARQASNDNGGFARPLNVRVINNAAGVEHEVRPGTTPDEVEIIARRVVHSEAPGAIAKDMSQPNGPTSKALRNHYGVGRARN